MIVLTTIGIGAMAFAIVALTRGGPVTFSLGVPTNGPVVTLAAGEAFCQEEIMPPGGGLFDRVEMLLGTFRRPGPPIEVTVRRGGRTLARGTLTAGYADVSEDARPTVKLDREVRAFAGMRVCFRNAGDRKVAWFGAGDGASVPTRAVLGDGTAAAADVSLAFLGEDRSYAERLGGIADRARLFRAGPLLPGWGYLLLVVGFVGLSIGGVALAVSSLRSESD